MQRLGWTFIFAIAITTGLPIFVSADETPSQPAEPPGTEAPSESVDDGVESRGLPQLRPGLKQPSTPLTPLPPGTFNKLPLRAAIGYDDNLSFGNNLFFSIDYPEGYIEDPGTYFIRAEIEYVVSSSTVSGTEKMLINPASVSVFPNPFLEDTEVRYILNQPGDVEITITDSKGSVVSKQIQPDQPTGHNSYHLEGTGLKPGMYFIQLKTAGQLIKNKLIKR